MLKLLIFTPILLGPFDANGTLQPAQPPPLLHAYMKPDTCALVRNQINVRARRPLAICYAKPLTPRSAAVE